MTATKADIRAQMRAQRAQVNDAARRAASDAVCAALLWRPEFQRAAEVACFLSLPQEIDTGAFLDTCRRLGKRVCVPAWDPDAHTYNLVRFAPSAAVVAGPHRVSEPAARQPVAPEQVEFAVVPGLAFDAHGGRLGYGHGYYDRILATCGPACVKAGVGYTWQVWPEDLPLTAHDVRMDLVVTECVVLVTGM